LRSGGYSSRKRLVVAFVRMARSEMRSTWRTRYARKCGFVGCFVDSAVCRCALHEITIRLAGPIVKTRTVESRKGARPGPTGNRRFPFPAHQTRRADFPHRAFRLASPQRPRKPSASEHRATALQITFFAL